MDLFCSQTNVHLTCFRKVPYVALVTLVFYVSSFFVYPFLCFLHLAAFLKCSGYAFSCHLNC